MNPRLLYSMVLRAAGRAWLGLPPGTFLPEETLWRTFRDMFLALLQKAYRKQPLTFRGSLAHLAWPDAFKAWIDGLSAIEWVVRRRCISAHDGSQSGDDENENDDELQKMIRYLARYTNRVAISNQRLIAIEGNDVLFRYKDYRDADQWKTKRMPGVVFVGQFIQHVLPQGLQHIRHFGFLGNNIIAKSLVQIRSILSVRVPGVDEEAECADGDPILEQEVTRICQQCGKGKMVSIWDIQRPSVAELMRMPASMEIATPVARQNTLGGTVARRPVQLFLPMTLPPCFDSS